MIILTNRIASGINFTGKDVPCTSSIKRNVRVLHVVIIEGLTSRELTRREEVLIK